MQKIICILDELSNLLFLCNQDIQANWLKHRTNILADTSKDQEREILAEIKKSIAGMGSLSDIYLVPPHSSGLLKSQANKKLYELLKELDSEIHRLLDLQMVS